MAPQREWFEKDYYAVLGVPNGATDKEITRAYRKLAKQYHPDANPGDAAAEERFKEVSAAHDVLGDAERRAEYDQVREMAASGAYAGGPGGFGGGGFGGGFEGFEGADISDLLGGLFGGGGRGFGGGRRAARHAPGRGDDLETELHVDFLDAVHGVTAPVRFTADAACSVCQGSGAEPGTPVERCATCGGSGQVAVNQGPFSFSQVCPACSGAGQSIGTPCHGCRGRGIEVRSREVKVRIPAGVDDGQRIRVKGRGAAGGRGGEPGDLYVVVQVIPHERFGRSGRNLTVRVPVTLAEAALGAEVQGIDLRTITDATFKALHDDWLNHVMLVFRGQSLDANDLVRLVHRFGIPVTSSNLPARNLEERTANQLFNLPPEVTVVTNIKENGKAVGILGDGEVVWHSDFSFKEKPTAARMLVAMEVPPRERGGSTSFLNGYAAYDALPADFKKRISGKTIKQGNIVDTAMKTWGRLDILVANHGIWPPQDVAVSEMSDAQWRRTIAINLDSVFGLEIGRAHV